MKESRFELRCAFMLGFGQLCLMTGYDTESFVLESVIHSIHEKEPERISQYAGYYGQAICYAFYMMTCLFSPAIINISNSKTLLVIASCCFTAFPLGFIYTNAYYFYFSSMCLGFGFALFYQGQGRYLTSHSTRQTIESNVSITWSLGCCCMIVGSIILAIITMLTADQNQIMLDSLNITSEAYRIEKRFSEREITFLFITLGIISFISIINHILIPSQDIENCIESSEKSDSFMNGIQLTFRTIISPDMLLLIPLFFLIGISTSFWISVFPTSMNFNMHNSSYHYILSIYSLGVGIGEVVMGFTISSLSKKIKNFGLRPTMIIGSFTITIYCILIFLSTPFEASIKPTHQPPLLFQPNQIFIFFLALIIGIADCCINSLRGIICSLVMPDKRAQAFAVSKFYQAISSCTIFFFSPNLQIYIYTSGLPILSYIATILFFIVSSRTKKMERKITATFELPKIDDNTRKF